MSEHKPNKELANELDAEDRLRGRGYTQEPCSSCRGSGMKMINGALTPCLSCDGRGFHWRADYKVIDLPGVAMKSETPRKIAARIARPESDRKQPE